MNRKIRNGLFAVGLGWLFFAVLIGLIMGFVALDRLAPLGTGILFAVGLSAAIFWIGYYST